MPLKHYTKRVNPHDSAVAEEEEELPKPKSGDHTKKRQHGHAASQPNHQGPRITTPNKKIELKWPLIWAKPMAPPSG
jgi:hypothetical protein